MKKQDNLRVFLKLLIIQCQVLHEECLDIREVQCTRKSHYTLIFNQQAHENRNAIVPKSEVLITSPISNRLVDVVTGSTYIFICVKEHDKCAWSTA